MYHVYKMQKGNDGVYHQDWYNNLMWGGSDGKYSGYTIENDYSAFWGTVFNLSKTGFRGSIKRNNYGKFGYYNYTRMEPYSFNYESYDLSILVGVGVGTIRNFVPLMPTNFGEVKAYDPNNKNWAEKWEGFNNNKGIKIFGGPISGVSSIVYGLSDGLWTAGSTLKNGWRNGQWLY
jgi:hypothetical protein